MPTPLYYVELQALQARRERFDTFLFGVGALVVASAVALLAYLR